MAERISAGKYLLTEARNQGEIQRKNRIPDIYGLDLHFPGFAHRIFRLANFQFDAREILVGFQTITLENSGISCFTPAVRVSPNIAIVVGR